MKYQLDLTNYRCPMPLLMTQKALKGLQQDDILCVQLNADNGSRDIELYCRQQGYDFSKITQDSALIVEIRL